VWLAMEVDMGRTERAVILGFILFGASEARAAVWAVNAAGCTSADPVRYTVASGSVSYRSTTQTGSITLFCPIATAPAACPTAYRLRLTYQDPDGSSPLLTVTAQLLRQSQQDGSFLGAVPGAFVSSNSSNVMVPTSRTSSAFDHDFSALADDYTVRVDMSRTILSSQAMAFYGVALECAE
jgi:hypothetical protein